MRAYPPDEHISHDELYDNHQTILITSDIEDIVLITHKVGGRENGPYVCEAFPLRILYNSIPPFQGNPGILVTWRFKELLKFSMRYDPHNVIFQVQR